MRTTLTLDDDVASALQERAQLLDKPFKQVVNEALRRGLLSPVLEQLIRGMERVGLARVVTTGFVRISTNPRVLEQPIPV